MAADLHWLRALGALTESSSPCPDCPFSAVMSASGTINPAKAKDLVEKLH